MNNIFIKKVLIIGICVWYSPSLLIAMRSKEIEPIHNSFIAFENEKPLEPKYEELEPPFMTRYKTHHEQEQRCCGYALAIAELLAWTTAELLYAYNTTSFAEWDNASQLHEKVGLLIQKTGSAMISRPRYVYKSLWSQHKD